MSQFIIFFSIVSIFTSTGSLLFFFFKSSSIRNNFWYFIFILSLAVYEIVIFSSAQLSMHNHILANIYSAIYYPLTIFLIFRSLYFHSKSRIYIYIMCVLIVCFGFLWGWEVLPDIHYFKSFTPLVFSLLIILICTYFINYLIFVTPNGILKHTEGNLVIALLIRSIGGSIPLFIMSEVRFRFNTIEVFMVILLVTNIFILVSDVFLIKSILCLPSKKKSYTERYLS